MADIVLTEMNIILNHLTGSLVNTAELHFSQQLGKAIIYDKKVKVDTIGL